MGNIDNYWYKVSDLTIGDAAYWTEIKTDPRAHKAQCEKDNAYAEHFNDHPMGAETVAETSLAIISATRVGDIKITREEHQANGHLNSDRTFISKSDWLAWCRRNGSAELADEFEQTIAPNNSLRASAPSCNWQEAARTIADELFNHDTENGCRDSLHGYSQRVVDEMRERVIHGPRGLIGNARTIQREALQGARWWANKAR